MVGSIQSIIVYYNIQHGLRKRADWGGLMRAIALEMRWGQESKDIKMAIELTMSSAEFLFSALPRRPPFNLMGGTHGHRRMPLKSKGPVLIVIWLPLTASCLSPLSWLVSQPGNVRKLLGTWGWRMVSAGYSGLLHYLQLATHDLTAILHTVDCSSTLHADVTQNACYVYNVTFWHTHTHTHTHTHECLRIR